jgi:hypothetical protein
MFHHTVIEDLWVILARVWGLVAGTFASVFFSPHLKKCGL